MYKRQVKTYSLGKNEVQALKGVSLDIHKGEFLALTGASGSGKSTLLQMIGGLDKPTSGAIAIDNTELQMSLIHTSCVYETGRYRTDRLLLE